MKEVFRFMVGISLCFIGVQCANVNDVAAQKKEKLLHFDLIDCGTAPITDKVGRPSYSKSDFGEVPWKVVILNSSNDKAFCTGSIINEWYILTAASCFNGFSRETTSLQVRINDYNLTANPDCISSFMPKIFKCQEIFATTLGVQKVHLHPQFNTSTLVNDIALIKTSDKIELNYTVNPVCLPLSDVEVAHNMNLVEMYGWGISSSKNPNFEVLYRMYANIIQQEECQKMYGSKRTIYHNQICIKPTNTAMSKCIEDNGGSLEQISDIGVAQTGVASLGKEGCRLDLPTVYTNISQYTTWITETLKSEIARKSSNNLNITKYTLV